MEERKRSKNAEIYNKLYQVIQQVRFFNVIICSFTPFTSILPKISSAVYDTLGESGIIDKITAFAFNTTSSDTGRSKGACILLEKRIKRNIFLK